MSTRKVVARHGDMIFLKVENSQSEGLKSVTNNKLVVGLGEKSGHSHSFKPVGSNSQIIEFFSEDEEKLGIGSQDFIQRDRILFEVKGQAVVYHEEHDPIVLEEGTYVRIIQTVYDPITEAIRKVRD